MSSNSSVGGNLRGEILRCSDRLVESLEEAYTVPNHLYLGSGRKANIFIRLRYNIIKEQILYGILLHTHTVLCVHTHIVVHLNII